MDNQLKSGMVVSEHIHQHILHLLLHLLCFNCQSTMFVFNHLCFWLFLAYFNKVLFELNNYRWLHKQKTETTNTCTPFKLHDCSKTNHTNDWPVQRAKRSVWPCNSNSCFPHFWWLVCYYYYYYWVEWGVGKWVGVIWQWWANTSPQDWGYQREESCNILYKYFCDHDVTFIDVLFTEFSVKVARWLTCFCTKYWNGSHLKVFKSPCVHMFSFVEQ